MGSAARWVVGIIIGSIVASPFTEPINWWINRYLDSHPQALPDAVAQVWRLIQMVAELIPSGLFPGIALGATLGFLLLRGWRKERVVYTDNMPVVGPDSQLPMPKIEDEDARYYLALFAIDFVLPACQTHLDLQNAVVERVFANNAYLLRIVRQGIRSEDPIRSFWDSFKHLESALHGSPIKYVSLIDLMNHIARIETGYSDFCKETDRLMQGRAIKVSDDNEIGSFWEKWRVCHNTLVVEYDSIKRDRRFPKLLRPGRSSRWGGVIPPR